MCKIDKTSSGAVFERVPNQIKSYPKQRINPKSKIPKTGTNFILAWLKILREYETVWQIWGWTATLRQFARVRGRSRRRPPGLLAPPPPSRAPLPPPGWPQGWGCATPLHRAQLRAGSVGPDRRSARSGRVRARPGGRGLARSALVAQRRLYKGPAAATSVIQFRSSEQCSSLCSYSSCRVLRCATKQPVGYSAIQGLLFSLVRRPRLCVECVTRRRKCWKKCGLAHSANTEGKFRPEIWDFS